jgi:hypothetical protein
MIQTNITTAGSGTSSYSFDLSYRILRSPSTDLTIVNYRESSIQKVNNSVTNISNFQNLAWTDTPSDPGTYTYIIQIHRNSSGESSISSVSVGDRSVGAIVFPPV